MTATAGNAQATISWTALASTSTGGSAVTAYNVSCSAAGQTTRTAATTGATTATVTQLANSVEYSCTVTATNANGTGAASSAATVTPIAGSPGAPTAVSATAGNAQATVSWTAANANGSPITRYDVTCTPGGVSVDAGTATSKTVGGLTNGTQYSCSVRATNAVGQGPASSAVSVTPVGSPSVPSGVSAAAGNGQATVSWSAPAANGSAITGYRVRTYRSGVLDGPAALVAAPSLSTTVTGLTNDTAYTFTVSAINAAGESAESAASAAVTPRDGGGGGGTPPPPPPAPPREATTPVAPPSEPGQSTTTEIETSGGIVTITLNGLEDEATVLVTVRDEPPVREGLQQLPVSFDIDVTGAQFETVEIVLPYDAGDLQALGLEEERLSMFHFEGDAVFDITTSLDTDANTITGTASTLSPFSLGVPVTDRLAGRDRYATAAAVSAATYGPGVPVVYVATGAAFADALAAGPAAAADGGPILLVERDTVPAATSAELERLEPDQIVVLGGVGAISASVEAALRAFSSDVVRLAGAERFATAAAVSAATFEPGVAVAYLATGGGFADALAGGAAAALDGGPLLLTTTDALPSATSDELVRLAPRRIFVLGGPGAVSDAVLDAVERVVGIAPERLAGADRYATAAAVSAARFASSTTDAYIATGTTFPDALAAVPVAAGRRAPVLLVPGTTVPAVVAGELARLTPNAIVILGGTAAVGRQAELDASAFVVSG